MISVCLATFNGARFIVEQIGSILPQLSEGDELIVSDDGSKDETLSLIAGINDPRVRIIRNEGKHGIIWNFENALKAAQGDYIYLSDQDDIWEPNKIEECQKELEKGADLILHDCSLVDSSNNILKGSLFEVLHSAHGFWHNVYKSSFHGCCMAFRRKHLLRVLPFPKHIGMHDYWIGLRAARKGRVSLIYKPLIRYRIHNSNASNASGKSPFSSWQKIKFRFWILFYNIL